MVDPIPTNAEIESIAGVVSRHRHETAQTLSYEQRMEAFERLQRSAMETLRSNPGAFKSYLRRNHRKRRIDNVARLEEQLLLKQDRHDSC